MTASDSSAAHLRARLAIVEQRVKTLIELRRGTDPNPDDAFRGLYVSDDQVDRMLAGPPETLPPSGAEAIAGQLQLVETWAGQAQASGAELRLANLRRSFGLDGWDLELLLIALAPDLDPRFERLYGYLNDDVSRRRACIGLALDLCGVNLRDSPEADVLVGHLHPEAPLCGSGLLLVEESDRPLLTRPLRVPDRVISHLLGDNRPDPAISPYLARPPIVGSSGVDIVSRALSGGMQLVYVQDSSGVADLSVGASALAAAGTPPVTADLSLVEPAADLASVFGGLVREARLRNGGLAAGPIDALADRTAEGIRLVSRARCPVVLAGSRGWDPRWSDRVPFAVESSRPPLEDQLSYWSACLNGDGPAASELARATAHFRLTAEQVRRSATFALQAAAVEGGPVTVETIQAGARTQNAGGMERLTRRVRPEASWADLVLPADTMMQLRELAERARLSPLVMPLWNRGSSKGSGVAALFAGDSGTGKTMSAEIIAGDLGLDLYVIDLSTVIDKYVGETEKNLERIFVEADRVNGVLLFDEADAIFGKRSEVQDAHDRYANVETAYLLQRIERFDGLAILTTNLRANVDEAFTRRLDAIIDFPTPEEEDRRRLWEVHLKRGIAVAGGVDLDFMARSFKLSGGNIANIVLGAAFLAASEDAPLAMAHLIRSTEREYRKLGHLCVPEEFGEYYGLIARPAAASA